MLLLRVRNSPGIDLNQERTWVFNPSQSPLAVPSIYSDPPERFGGIQQLINVPGEDLNRLIDQYYAQPEKTKRCVARQEAGEYSCVFCFSR